MNDVDVLVRKFVYGPGIDEPICMERTAAAGGGGLFYYHYDGLGLVAALSDVNGVIVERYSYDVFGEPNVWDANGDALTVSSVGNPYMFTGRRFDTETELYYYRARYYYPRLGRFLQTDPIGYWAGMNLYSYCGNNPLNWIDPWGLVKEDKRSWWDKLCDWLFGPDDPEDKLEPDGPVPSEETSPPDALKVVTDSVGYTPGNPAKPVGDIAKYGEAALYTAGLIGSSKHWKNQERALTSSLDPEEALDALENYERSPTAKRADKFRKTLPKRRKRTKR